jgi:hypothetical protein
MVGGKGRAKNGWRWILFFGILSLGAPALASRINIEKEVGSFLPEFKNASVVGERAVFGWGGEKVAGLRLLAYRGRHLEIVYSESGASRVPLLLGVEGRFLTDSVARVEDSARRIIHTRFGDSGRIGQTRLIRRGPLSYWARIDYSQNGKPLGNLLLDLPTQKIQVGRTQPKEHLGRNKSRREGIPADPGAPRKIKILPSVPCYPLFFSDRATCLAMILGYWAAKGYPELMGMGGANKGRGDDLLREWIRGIDLIGRDCPECQSVEKTIEVLSSWSGLPLAVRLIRGEAWKDGQPSFQMIQRLIEQENQPFLVVDAAGVSPHFGVGMGYLVAGGCSFVACLVPGPPDLKSVWNPVFINWEKDFQDLNFYRISPASRNG